MRKNVIKVALLALLVSAAGCSNDNQVADPTNEGDLKPIPAAYSKVQHTPYAQQSNVLANKLLAVLSAQTDHQGKNVCVAPVSMQYMLSMFANGSTGRLQQEVVSAMGYEDINKLNEDNLAMLNNLAQDDEYVTALLCNSIWLNQDNDFKPAYKDAIQKYYRATMERVDMWDKSLKAIQQINSWIEENTGNAVKSDDFYITKTDLMVVANANYFDAKWAVPFDPKYTKDAVFANADGTTATVPTMNTTVSTNYYVDESLQVAELNYGQGYYSMMIVMPQDTESLDAVAAKADWWAWHEKTTQGLAEVSLPRFAITTTWLNIADCLPALGIHGATGSVLDNLIVAGKIGIDRMIQSTTIKVDENGTKVATSSLGSGGDIAPRTVELTFNKPFVYAIRENTTGAILFMGKVVKL